jgi:hypothetical protein
MIPLTLAISLALCAPPQEHIGLEETLHLIRLVETGGEPSEGRGSKGDGGASLGPFQIQRPYFIDSRTPGKYEDVLHDTELSKRVVRGYFKRYSPDAYRRLEAGVGTLADLERVSRQHNGGPRGHRKKATDSYWTKILKTRRKQA